MRNKWLIAAAAIGIHISIGSVYAWSVLTEPIMKAMDISITQVTWVFSLAILALGFSASILGSFVEFNGPSKSGLLSTLFFICGLLGIAFSIHIKSLISLYAFGLIWGIGLGIGYITPVSTLVKYFPEARGLATGMAIMGFGFASLIAAPLMQYFIARVGLIENFLLMSVIYSIFMILSSLYLKPPADINMNVTANAKNAIAKMKHFTVKEAVSTWEFKALWWMFFVNITCGIALLAIAAPMSMELIHLSAVEAAALVGVIGIVNGLGRLLWSAVSDYIGRKLTYTLLFCVEIISFALLAHLNSRLLFEFVLLVIVSCYGGMFACMPAYLSDLFGIKYLSAIHGRVLSAWGIAGIAGPLTITALYALGYGYALSLSIFTGFLVLNLIFSLLLTYKSKL